MNQSRTKAKVLLVASIAILLFVALFVISIVEIRQYNNYLQKISSQEQQIKDLENAKDYLNSNNYDTNASRDNNHAQDGDLSFMED